MLLFFELWAAASFGFTVGFIARGLFERPNREEL